jgi:predicted Zn-dependent protease
VLFDDALPTDGERAGPGPEGAGGDGPPTPRRQAGLAHRLLGAAGAGLVVLAGSLWLVDRSSSSPAAGQAATTATTGQSSITYELVEADLLAQDHPLDALVIYQEVLQDDPAQPVALAAEGWIYAQGGFVAQGLSLLAKAEKADPSYPPPHLYRGLVLLGKSHQPAAAAAELKWYLAHGPSKSELKTARAALAQAVAEETAAKG